MDRKTIETYDKLAKEYDDETVDFWNQFPRTFLDRFIELSGIRVLDVGSGPGRDGLLLKNSGKEIVCLDASAAMVQLSKERGLTSVLADFDQLPFESESFDAVWSYTALLHVPKATVGTSLNEIYRVLCPHGLFGLGLIEGDSEFYRESSGVGMPRWFSFYQKDEVLALLNVHGFELEYFETFKPRSKNYLNFIARKQ